MNLKRKRLIKILKKAEEFKLVEIKNCMKIL